MDIQDIEEKAKVIMDLAIKMPKINYYYSELNLKDRLELAAKILQIDYIAEIHIMLAEIDNSIVDLTVSSREINFIKNQN